MSTVLSSFTHLLHYLSQRIYLFSVIVPYLAAAVVVFFASQRVLYQNRVAFFVCVGGAVQTCLSTCILSLVPLALSSGRCKTRLIHRLCV